LLHQLCQAPIQRLHGLELSGSIHAIYRTTWDISQLLNNPLIDLTGSQGSLPDSLSPFCSEISSELALIPLARLQTIEAAINEAALSPSASNSSAIAHFHLVNVLLNAPLRDLISFASLEKSNAHARQVEARLRRWLGEGQRARRAFFHAGSLFGYVKDHCRLEYYGAIALTVATLTLWVYNLLLGRHASQENASLKNSTMRLDGSTDSSSVKAWIIEGAPIRLFVAEVGNLCHPDANSRIIQVACQTLLSTSSWGMTQKLVNILMSLNVHQSDEYLSSYRFRQDSE
jgi:hypothetical protein